RGRWLERPGRLGRRGPLAGDDRRSRGSRTDRRGSGCETARRPGVGRADDPLVLPCGRAASAPARGAPPPQDFGREVGRGPGGAALAPLIREPADSRGPGERRLGHVYRMAAGGSTVTLTNTPLPAVESQ